MIKNKHIIRFLFIALFINIVANIVLYRYFMIEEVVLKQTIEQGSRLAEIYKRKVWDNNPAAIKKLNSNNYINLLQDKDFIEFVQESSDFFSYNKVGIALYDHLGNRFVINKPMDSYKIEYDKTDNFYNKIILKLDKYFLSEYKIKKPLSITINGIPSHTITSRAVINEAEREEKSFINSYIPLYFGKDEKVAGVIRITSDITEQWDNITYLETRIFIVFIFVFIVFFVLVIYNTNYARRIITSQHEKNLALELAKIKAETESTDKSDFLANVSHELRTPLNTIIGFSQLIIQESYGKIENEQYADYIDDINASGKHLLTVINDILDFSKLSAKKLNICNIELDLYKLAASSMRFVKPGADKSGVNLVINEPTERVVINADPKRLKQSLMNLLSISVKFTPRNGTVKIEIIDEKDKVLIIVSDDGIGMSEADIPKALSSFGQVYSALNRKYEGTGLGLPLTKKLIELMGGTFDLTSKVNNGTNVTITFQK
jgi:two-component system cell cycle sensor histidine kinase PleC